MDKEKLYKADNGKINGRLIYPISYYERVEISNPFTGRIVRDKIESSFDLNDPETYKYISIDGFFAGKDVETEEDYYVRTYQHEEFFPYTPDLYKDNYVLFMEGTNNLYSVTSIQPEKPSFEEVKKVYLECKKKGLSNSGIYEVLMRNKNKEKVKK